MVHVYMLKIHAYIFHKTCLDQDIRSTLEVINEEASNMLPST